MTDLREFSAISDIVHTIQKSRLAIYVITVSFKYKCDYIILASKSEAQIDL